MWIKFLKQRLQRKNRKYKSEAADDKTETCIVTVTAKKTSPEIPEEGPALVKAIAGCYGGGFFYVISKYSLLGSVIHDILIPKQRRS